jgi:hypothetical protein
MLWKIYGKKVIGYFRILHKEGNVIECSIPVHFGAENQEGYNGLLSAILIHFIKKNKIRNQKTENCA